MQIAITGSTGRVGRAIVALALAEGHTVVGMDRVPAAPDQAHANFTAHVLEVTDYDAVLAAMRGCDTLIHMAAIPGPFQHPDHIVHNGNVVGSYNALRAAAELGMTRVVQASSVNAIGGAYSRQPRYDYFPVDELHPTYTEDPYSLSKWICELQADSMVRRYEHMKIASLRFHAVMNSVADFDQADPNLEPAFGKVMWGWTSYAAAARASLLALTADFEGHQVFYIVAPEIMRNRPSLDLAQQYFPEVPLRGDFSGQRGFFDCAKAERMLGWKHDAA